MKYFREEPLLDRKGVQIEINTPEGDKGLTTGLYMYLVIGAYSPRQDFVLSTRELRSYNKVLDILDEEPKDGYWVFEDTDFSVAKKVVEYFAPRITLLFGYAPVMEDKLNGTLDKLEDK